MKSIDTDTIYKFLLFIKNKKETRKLESYEKQYLSSYLNPCGKISKKNYR